MTAGVTPLLFQNALTSIQLCIDDYKSNDPRRTISAVRNFYAGVLLLGKQCLLEQAPDADPMQVLATTFQPMPDDAGGVTIVPKGFRTIDLGELRERFKQFDIDWPKGDISRLQRLRNEFEHFHSSAQDTTIREVIASCFPLVDGFFEILDRNPPQQLGAAWETMPLVFQTFSREGERKTPGRALSGGHCPRPRLGGCCNVARPSPVSKRLCATTLFAQPASRHTSRTAVR